MLTPEQQAAAVKIAAAAVASERSTGCPAELSAAQCIFESAYLRRMPGNNCFGIKPDAHGSGTKYTLTSEFISGEWIHKVLEFEAYATLADCFADHARLIQQGIYAEAWRRYQADHDLDRYIVGVALHYASDPDYRIKISTEAHSSTVQMAVQAARAAVIS